MRSVLLASTFIWFTLVGLSSLQATGFAAQPEGSEAAVGATPAEPSATAPASGATGTDAPAAPAPSEDEAQRRQALQRLISDHLSRATDRKDEQTAVKEFYTQRAFQPLWTDGGVPNVKAQGAITNLSNVIQQGLDPADYPRPELPPLLNADNAAAAELQLTLSVLAYARHASSGRVSYTRVSASILYPASTITPQQVLSQVEASADIAATLAGFEPPQPGYKALQAQLVKELANPFALKQGGGDKKGGSKTSATDLIVANMERWRWLPRELGSSYVMVNIPQYTLQFIDHGRQVWATKIVVGKPGEMATPLLSETMKYLTINPTWNVPPSIIRNEYLPALERDSGALERIGLKIERNRDGSVRVYQPPGSKNALGRIRFNFPNPFLVYQHDTPNKNLFAMEKRALSHGCMRVQNPDQYAEALLAVSQPKQNMSADRIRALYGNDERTINLQKPIPVHVTYQTVWVDEAGHLVKRDDIYGLDAAILTLMRGPERVIADKAIPRNYESSSKPVIARLPRSYARRNDEHQAHGSFATNQSRQVAERYPAAFFDRAVGSW